MVALGNPRGPRVTEGQQGNTGRGVPRLAVLAGLLVLALAGALLLGDRLSLEALADRRDELTGFRDSHFGLAVVGFGLGQNAVEDALLAVGAEFQVRPGRGVLGLADAGGDGEAALEQDEQLVVEDVDLMAQGGERHLLGRDVEGGGPDLLETAMGHGKVFRISIRAGRFASRRSTRSGRRRGGQDAMPDASAGVSKAVEIQVRGGGEAGECSRSGGWRADHGIHWAQGSCAVKAFRR